MSEWHRQVQLIIDHIDQCIRANSSEDITLRDLSGVLGYSEYTVSRRFREISGMHLRDYLRMRKMAFALLQVRDSEKSLLDIALDFGFSSHEAFTRAFRETYGVSPSEYRRHPTPVVLRTAIRPFDCFVVEQGLNQNQPSSSEVKTYFVTIPAHQFLHIRHYESIGYWDFWQKQAQIPGCDCHTICGLLESIPGKLDDLGMHDLSSGSGQVMAWINEPTGRLCSWGIPLAEAYGVRLPEEWQGSIPPQMQLMDVPEGEYIVFEHGPFDYSSQNQTVEEKIEAAMRTFDYEASGYHLDLTQGRIFYHYHDPERYWKFIRPVKKADHT